jgi:4-amino-4-deoxy-L-arabinose transferase-like glycosyltransferase
MPKYFLPIIVVALTLSLFRLGTAKLFDVDEAVFSEATREMVIDRNWITPTYNGNNRYDKPILFYWLMAASYGVFGVNEFAARFPSALAASLLTVALLLFVSRVKGGRIAGYAALSAVLSVYFVVYSRAAVTDMTLTLFLSLSLFCMYLFTERGGNRLYGYGFYLFSALAFLTKGLIGIVFPFGIALVYLWVSEGRHGPRKVFSAGGFLLFFIVAAPWYLAQVGINGWEFIGQFFIKHHFRRYTDVISGHRGPFYYYIPAMIIGLFPWIAFLPAGIRSALREKKGIPLFSLVWLGVVFLFFSFSTTKLPNYILPSIPAAAMLIGVGMAEADGNWRRYSLLAMGVLALCLAAGFFIAEGRLAGLVSHDTGWLLWIAAMVLGASAVCFFSAFTSRAYVGPVAVLIAAFLFLLMAKGLPLASDYLQDTLYQYSLYAHERLQPDEGLIVFGMNNHSIAFYSGRRLIAIDDKKDLAALTERETHAVAIAKVQDIDMFRGLGYNLLEHDSRYAILERK